MKVQAKPPERGPLRALDLVRRSARGERVEKRLVELESSAVVGFGVRTVYHCAPGVVDEQLGAVREKNILQVIV